MKIKLINTSAENGINIIFQDVSGFAQVQLSSYVSDKLLILTHMRKNKLNILKEKTQQFKFNNLSRASLPSRSPDIGPPEDHVTQFTQ